MRALDLVGKQFNRLTVLKRVENDKDGHTRWLCKCVCGNEKEVLGKHLTSGKIRSCGCYHREVISTQNNMNDTYIYRVWRNIIGRCRDITNPYYGGKGIKVCKEWENSFSSFCEWSYSHGYADSLTIDRIDSTKGYCPENCRWVDYYVQNNNLSTNHVLTYQGETHTVAEWCRILDLNESTVRSRIARKCPVDIILSKRKWVNQYV